MLSEDAEEDFMEEVISGSEEEGKRHFRREKSRSKRMETGRLTFCLRKYVVNIAT